MYLSAEDLEVFATAFPAIAAQLERLHSHDLSDETYPFSNIFPEALQ
jgi:hypothetical protein